MEKRGNVSKVAIEVEMLPGASGTVEVEPSLISDTELISGSLQFDLEVRYTFRVDEPASTLDKAVGNTGSEKEGGSHKEEFKTFTLGPAQARPWRESNDMNDLRRYAF